MFPFAFEWIWDMGHYVFHGGLWYALSIIGAGMTYCIGKAAYDTLIQEKGSHEDEHH